MQNRWRNFCKILRKANCFLKKHRQNQRVVVVSHMDLSPEPDGFVSTLGSPESEEGEGEDEAEDSPDHCEVGRRA